MMRNTLKKYHLIMKKMGCKPCLLSQKTENVR